VKQQVPGLKPHTMEGITTMQHRPLGTTEVPTVGLGCMGFSFAFTEDPDSDRPEDVIHAALDLGVSLFDTADLYGDNELILGQALQGRRDEAFIATKCGLSKTQELPLITVPDGRPEHIRTSVDNSLLRLGVEVLDLFQLHYFDPNVPVAETWGAMAEAVTSGKALAIGASNATVEQLEIAHGIHPVASCQSELSLWSREPLDDVLPWCTAHGTTFIAFSPLGRGFLAGTIRPGEVTYDESDLRSSLARFSDDAIERNQALVDVIRQVGDRVGATVAQVSLAWVLAQAPGVITIPGTRRVTRLQENVAAADLVLSAQDLADLDGAPLPLEPRVRW
jgi:aryl-alcohol dehydrogenase-like predicted oxidoreductase